MQIFLCEVQAARDGTGRDGTGRDGTGRDRAAHCPKVPEDVTVLGALVGKRRKGSWVTIGETV
jgi:hypothetical protein